MGSEGAPRAGCGATVPSLPQPRRWDAATAVRQGHRLLPKEAPGLRPAGLLSAPQPPRPLGSCPSHAGFSSPSSLPQVHTARGCRATRVSGPAGAPPPFLPHPSPVFGEASPPFPRPRLWTGRRPSRTPHPEFGDTRPEAGAPSPQPCAPLPRAGGPGRGGGGAERRGGLRAGVQPGLAPSFASGQEAEPRVERPTGGSGAPLPPRPGAPAPHSGPPCASAPQLAARPGTPTPLPLPLLPSSRRGLETPAALTPTPPRGGRPAPQFPQGRAHTPGRPA